MKRNISVWTTPCTRQYTHFGNNDEFHRPQDVILTDK